MTEPPDPISPILSAYRQVVQHKHNDRLASWPILSGANRMVAGFNGWLIVFFKHTGNPTMVSQSGAGQLATSIVGANTIDPENRRAVRVRLEQHFRAGPDDAVVLVAPDGSIDDSEYEYMLTRHERAMGLAPMKIFLSHKSTDKVLVRDFKATLEALGFHPWLDEDAMQAGAQLERAVLRGFQDSCAAIFFITPQFKDERYLASEIEYAIGEKRKKGDRFAIITLVFAEGDNKPSVPDLLRPYVWKEPQSHLQALREILRALPVEVGDIKWK